ncbi:hypothetical protein BDA96_03G366400 [Sorghum bicolor]|jgi:hypothetical protein|uniref:RING-type E3 ubiquitin transferase n=2 Tax=Sorghum bicolor TaxID=4558 RepID=A0A921UQ11_SORBI|nr:E3 ubiquitin-protein ligase EL5 [Sorghum bicolor]EES01675.1 hypothetical protein SORBI_3003G339400 [Sorghum bicolor]KAG0539949.1 hypothetical protein BDA96_03G366400 [Sorghum bicolor]|eukprot:XP_002456555.1 E3 ubiquitin-protein ligase EL5 [Sorghum bicolor]
MAGAIFLGVLAGLVVLICTIVCAVRHCQDGAGSAKVGGGGGVSSPAGKQEALLNKNKNKDDVDVVVAVPHQPGGAAGKRGPEPSDGDVDLCAICKARLADASWGRCRRLRPCGHVYHADCISLWLQRKWICPVCRAAVAMSRTEILDAVV